MASRKILYVCQEIMPYLPETELSPTIVTDEALAIEEVGFSSALSAMTDTSEQTSEEKTEEI